MLHHIVGDDSVLLELVAAARIEVAAVFRERRGRDLNADTVPRQEGVGRGHRREVELVGLALLHEDLLVIASAKAGAEDGVVEDVGRTIGRDIDELYCEVGVFRIRRDVQDRVDKAGDSNRRGQRIGRIDQNVVTNFGRALVKRAGDDNAAIAAVAAANGLHRVLGS